VTNDFITHDRSAQQSQHEMDGRRIEKTEQKSK
jgi:hypothetical protein